MPNQNTVEAPVTLVGPGRSGTTLVTNIFRRHPDFRAVGETSNLIFTVYRTMEASLPFCGQTRENRQVPDAARDAVHQMLIDLFGASTPAWFHKPILLPSIHGQWADQDEFRAWYWSTFTHLFPRGRVFTVLRPPAETAASMVARWGGTPEDAFGRISRCYDLMLHPSSRLEMVLHFDTLTKEPEGTVRRLLEFGDVAYDPGCLEAYDQQHAANEDSARRAVLDVPPDVLRGYERLLERV